MKDVPFKLVGEKSYIYLNHPCVGGDKQVYSDTDKNTIASQLTNAY